jgi:hypothetical protein
MGVPQHDATIRLDGDRAFRRCASSRSRPRTHLSWSFRHNTTAVPPAASTIGATGDRASKSRPAVRQLAQWQMRLVIGAPAASKPTAPHAHVISFIA